MRYLLSAVALAALALPRPASAATLGTCESSVGPWEIVSQSGGRAVVARDGSKYHAMWLTRVATADGGTTEPAAGAAECTCENAPAMLAWQCRITYSLRPDEIGTTLRYEWAIDGENLRSFPIGPDGKRIPGLAFRRPR
jgi:hypothetical protein